jgi:hypothetical protein
MIKREEEKKAMFENFAVFKQNQLENWFVEKKLTF